MNFSDIIDLSNKLTSIPVDQSTLSRFLSDIIESNGLSTNNLFFKATIFPLTATVGTYSFNPDMLQIIEAYFDDSDVHFATIQEINAYNKNWLVSTDSPEILIQDARNARTFTLYPIPDTTSDSIIPIHAEPFGEDYPSNSLVLIYSDNRTDNIPSIYGIPLAFNALSHELSYPSDHTDLKTAQVYNTISSLIFGLIS